MMLYFYGVYLQNTEISTALDLVRFLGEPDSIRFSHITLRGPYQKRLNKHWLREINGDPQYEWKIKLLEPGTFFSTGQTTVFLKVDLCSLHEIFHKPDFPGGLPHLTVYDGKDLDFAKELSELLSMYEWRREVRVTRLRLIERKHKVDEVFLTFFMAFSELFRDIIGDPMEISLMKTASVDRRLTLIEKVLYRLHGDPRGLGRGIQIVTSANY